MSRSRTRTRTPAGKHRPASTGRVQSSWTALLAATSLGVAGASMLRADVQTDAQLDDSRSYRLVVQSYDHADIASLDPTSRPVASVQRAVTAEELRNGVRVGLVEFRQGRREADAPMGGSKATPLVLAWVEEGKPDLELDGLRARPLPGSLLGATTRGTSSDTVQISVRLPARVA